VKVTEVLVKMEPGAGEAIEAGKVEAMVSVDVSSTEEESAMYLLTSGDGRLSFPDVS
jgi:hypothetical protein